MNDKRQLSLDSLPAETIYQILDLLHCETIFISFANVCRRFRSIIQTYHRCHIDFSSISKSNFHIICRIVRPENVVSLILSDDEKTPGQIGLFLSFLNINTFRQLRHLTLMKIAAADLMKISRRLKLCSLISFTIDTRGRHIKLPVKMITCVIEQPSLCKMNLITMGPVLDKISWPMNCPLQHLKIQTCTKKQYLTIIDRLPHLKTLDIALYDVHATVSTSSTIHRSLVTLTLNIGSMPMVRLESLLLLTPSLVHLKLVSHNGDLDLMSNSSRWEEFIQLALPELEKFEFFFSVAHRRQAFLLDIEPLIEPFRRPFWLEHKHWYVCCEQSGTSQFRTDLYTIPICVTRLKYQKLLRKVCSTVNNLPNNSTCRVSSLDVDLTGKLMPSVLKENRPNTIVLFDKVIDVNLTLHGEKILESIQFISTFIDFSRLQQISIRLITVVKSKDNTVVNFGILLEQAGNLRSLTIRRGWGWYEYAEHLNGILSMLPGQLKHLRVDIRTTEQMKEVFQQISHVSSVAYRYTGWEHLRFDDFLAWLTEKGTDFTSITIGDELHMWLGKNGRKPNEILYPNKRLKTSL
ncbi:unnamed protein product [Rotaria sp. Silwood1]|nr:unnamed protein product [Rotaria sp. Silwood1]